MSCAHLHAPSRPQRFAHPTPPSPIPPQCRALPRAGAPPEVLHLLRLRSPLASSRHGRQSAPSRGEGGRGTAARGALIPCQEGLSAQTVPCPPNVGTDAIRPCLPKIQRFRPRNSRTPPLPVKCTQSVARCKDILLSQCFHSSKLGLPRRDLTSPRTDFAAMRRNWLP